MILAAAACKTGTLLTLHQGFWSVVVLYGTLMGLWGLFLAIRGSGPTGSYLGALILAGGVAVLEAIIGLALVISGERPHDPLHWLYGVVAVITLPAAYFLGSTGSPRRASLYFGIGAFFLVGIALRSATTGCT